MQVFVVGEVRSGKFPNLVWDLVGVFSTSEKAEDACREPNFCVMPIMMDEIGPMETMEIPGGYYPKS